MNAITQDMRYRPLLIKYAEKYGVTQAAIKYKTSRQYIWKRRYDGTLESRRNRSCRLYHSNQHTPEEINLISDSVGVIRMPVLSSFG